MTQAFEIPLQTTPQKFSITLSAVDYNMRVLWNDIAQCWCIDIADANEVPIVSSIPLITGVDLLEPYTDLGFIGQLIALTDYDLDAPPTFENLGITGHLYWVTS